MPRILELSDEEVIDLIYAITDARLGQRTASRDRAARLWELRWRLRNEVSDIGFSPRHAFIKVEEACTIIEAVLGHEVPMSEVRKAQEALRKLSRAESVQCRHGTLAVGSGCAICLSESKLK